MGSGDDGAHSQNEKIDVRNYLEGVSVFYAINFKNLLNITSLILIIFVSFIKK